MKTNNTFALIAQTREAANDYLDRELKRNGLTGLVPTHGGILAALTFRGPLTMKELSEEVRRNKSTITALITKLEGLGYVERYSSAEDNRVTLVRLTSAGQALKVPFEEISEGLMSVGLKNVTEEELQQLRSVLKKIIQNFD